MTVTFIKGLQGRLDQANHRAAHNPQPQQAAASVASSGQVGSDATVNSVRFNRAAESRGERLTSDKAGKLAESLANRVLADPELAEAAHGEFPATSLRDHFTP